MANIKFTTCKYADYASLPEKDANALYFTRDTLQLFKGDVEYGKTYEVVSDLPTLGQVGVLYINSSDNTISIWNDSEYQSLTKAYKTDALEEDASDDYVLTEKAVTDYVGDKIYGVKAQIPNIEILSQILPSGISSYNFENKESIFTTPNINGSSKGEAIIVTDEENNNSYQSIKPSGNIGTTANVYSQFEFPYNISSIEFDFQYVNNGRMRIALADLEVLNSKANSDLRWDKAGIATDIFSNSGYEIQINSTDRKKDASYFSQWMHIKLDFDFENKTVDYSLTTDNGETTISSGHLPFRDNTVTKVNGIALYTWLSGDTVYFDNIKITSTSTSDYFIYDENKLYLVPKEKGVQAYIYDNDEVRQVSFEILDGTITTDKIVAQSITADRISTQAITTDKINNGAVTTDKIDNSAITAEKIADNAIANTSIQSGAITTDKISTDLIRLINDKADISQVENLLNNANNIVIPEAVVTPYIFNFEDGNKVFTADSRISTTIEANSNGTSNVLAFTCAGNAQNGYSFAHYDFSDLINEDDVQITIELDYYNTNGGRAILTLGDASVRGTTGGSSKTTYSNIGAIFNLGSNKDNAIVNGSAKSKSTYTNKWLHVKVNYNITSSLYNYVITDVNGDIITSGNNITAINSDAMLLTQIDVFGYINDNKCALIDNLEITTTKSIEITDIELEENTVYFLPINGTTTVKAYYYKDNTMYILGSTDGSNEEFISLSEDVETNKNSISDINTQLTSIETTISDNYSELKDLLENSIQEAAKKS